MTIGTTNNSIGLNRTILTGPSDHTQVANAADPADASQPQPQANTGVDIGAVATSSVTAARKRKGRGKGNHVAQDEHKRQRRAALLLTTQGNTEAGT